MTTAGIQSVLFRHAEKIVLALVALFVFYQVYTTMFGTEVAQAPQPVSYTHLTLPTILRV